MTSEAVRRPLRAGFESRGRAGCWVARSLNQRRSCRLEQCGHAVFLEPVRFITGEVYEWPRRHSQWTIFSLPADTSLGVSCALRAGSHSLEICGCVVARSLIPARTFRPLQMGHPCPALRLAMAFVYTWPTGHSHAISARRPSITSFGERSPLRSRCHSAASSGCVVARSLTPGSTVWFEHTGQPEPLRARLATVASKVCPRWQRQAHFLLLPDTS